MFLFLHFIIVFCPLKAFTNKFYPVKLTNFEYFILMIRVIYIKDAARSRVYGHLVDPGGRTSCSPGYIYHFIFLNKGIESLPQTLIF